MNQILNLHLSSIQLNALQGKLLRLSLSRYLKIEIKKWIVQYGKLTLPMRRVPDFMIVGAQKAGTTSLYEYIGQHPQIKTCWLKEVHFFDNNFHRGMRWYQAHFPILLSRTSDVIVGESTPYYLIHPHAAERIHRLLPSVKIIILLRDPVERALSHYYHELRGKRETLSITEAFMKEEERIGQEWKMMLNDSSYQSQGHQCFSYKQRGIYVDQIKKYFQYFSQDQIFILDSQKLFSHPEETLCKIFRFLGVEENASFIRDLKPQYVNPIKKDVPSEVYRYLETYFAPHNDRLFAYLGRSFDWR